MVQVLKSENLFFGPEFPVEVDRLLCSLNPNVCEVLQQRRDDIPKIRWTHSSSDTLNIPALIFERYWTPQTYLKRAGDSIESIVVQDRQGCASFDDACRQLVLNLNHPTTGAIESHYDGPILVPSLAVRTTLTIEVEPSPSSRHPTSSPESENAYPKLEELRTIPTLSRRIAPSVAVSTDSLGAESEPHFDSHQRKFFESTGYPTAPLAGPRLFTCIAVIDGWVDTDHCDFSGTLESNNLLTPPVSRSKCDAHAPLAAGGSLDHATHIAGIIGAKINGVGIAGLSPDSDVVTFEVEAESATYSKSVAAVIRRAIATHPVKIFNLSRSYPREATSPSAPGLSPQEGGDLIENRIRQLRNNKLFVSSAGNDGFDLTNACDALPGCYEYSNVLSVGAVDDRATPPRILTTNGTSPGSNWGLRVHLLAPGRDVVSTLAGDRWGTMSGTSQAAPFVTAAAALLLSQDDSLSPSDLKLRLIYTSDYHQSLETRALGGVLNIARALNPHQDRLRTMAGEIEGEIEPSALIDFKRFDSTDYTQIRVGQILRLSLVDPDNQLYVLFLRDETASRQGLPRRETGVLLRTVTVEPFRIRTEGGTHTRHHFSDVLDYVARMPQ